MAKKKNSQPQQRDEIAELERAYADMTGHRFRKKRSSAPSLLLMLALLLVVGFIVYSFYKDGISSLTATLDNVTVAGVDLSGMTRSQAAEALEAACSDTYEHKDMVISVGDTEVALTPADTGARLDVEAVLDTAFAREPVDTLSYLNLDLTSVEAALEELDALYNVPAGKTSCSFDEENQLLIITLGTPQYGLDINALRQAVLDAYRNNHFQVQAELSTVEPEMPDLDSLHEQYFIAAEDAVMDMQTFEITPDVTGRTFDLDGAKTALDALEYGQTLTIPLEQVSAEVTYDSLSAILYRDVLGSCSTKHTWNPGRTENLRLACEAINGMILMPGEQFNYNEALGERTAEKGYQSAPSYVYGETVDTLGGGICQVSSTLYYCALLADFQIDVRYPHGYAPDYMDLGMDATVSWGNPNFKFTNNTNYPVRIEASVSDGYVHVSVLGTDEKDYYVKMEYAVLETIPYETVYKDYPPDNEKGFTDGQVITTPYTGYRVRTFKCRYDKETGERISRDVEADSNYKSRDKVICRIVEPTEATQETEATVPVQIPEETSPPEPTA